jgi:hypothetical protein
MMSDLVNDKPKNILSYMVNWMKTKGVNIRNNEEINKGEGVNEEKTLTNFSNFD